MNQQHKFSLLDLVLYFLKLGTTGFGGPAALVSYMERDLVEDRKWFTKEEYVEGMALAQLAPGPLAAQLAIYFGWAKSGVLGATLVGIAFVIPSLLLCIGLAIAYIKFGNLSWIQSLFYSISAAVIGIIVHSSHKLFKKTVGKDRSLLIVWGLSAAYTAITETEAIGIFLLGGAFYLLVKGPLLSKVKLTNWAPLIPLWALSGLEGPANNETLLNIGTYFTKAGAFVFGSGLAIVPFLHSGVVQEFGWLSEKQFIDAVAVAMITPGPVVITVAFIGYLVAGPAGSIIAALGTFLPCYFFTVIPAPYYHHLAKRPWIKYFIQGVTAAAIGAIAGATWVLGKRAIIDVPTAIIAGTSLLLLIKLKVPEPILIILAGLVGLLLKGI